MRISILAVICGATLAVSASAQNDDTVCLGVNCPPPRITLDPSAFDNNHNVNPASFGGAGIFNPDRQECYRKCNKDYFDRAIDCYEVYEGSTSPLRDTDYDACIEANDRARQRCLVVDRCNS